MINYTAEARHINDLVNMEDRENAYASLASRLADERDELQRRCAALKQEITYWKRGNISCAAASATLDALRDEFKNAYAILYPQPAALEGE